MQNFDLDLLWTELKIDQDAQIANHTLKLQETLQVIVFARHLIRLPDHIRDLYKLSSMNGLFKASTYQLFDLL